MRSLGIDPQLYQASDNIVLARPQWIEPLDDEVEPELEALELEPLELEVDPLLDEVDPLEELLPSVLTVLSAHAAIATEPETESVIPIKSLSFT